MSERVDGWVGGWMDGRWVGKLVVIVTCAYTIF